MRHFQMLAVVVLVGSCVDAGERHLRKKEKKQQLPERARSILEKADRFELFSLDPNAPKLKPGQGFHGWKVLGKTPVKEKKVQEKIMSALARGIAEQRGAIADCFKPRHGIRAFRKKEKVDLVICFECYQVLVLGDKEATKVLTTRSPQPVFDRVLTRARVPLPRKAKP
jgi:hypothetical protein